MNQSPFKTYERKVHAQHGEDGIIEHLFEILGEGDRWFVEVGLDGGNGEDNTRFLADKGWRGVWIDHQEVPSIYEKVVSVRRWVTAENLDAIMDAHQVPECPDFFSLDIDGIDYWVWLMLRRRPRVVCVEYNGCKSAAECTSIPYQEAFVWHLGCDYFGATLAAMDGAASTKGYHLIGCDSTGSNAFFLRDDVMQQQDEFRALTVGEAWIKLNAHRPDRRRMMRVPRRPE